MVEQRKRQIAFKVSIKELLDGEFVEQGGWNLDFVRVRGFEVSRVNVVGVVVSVSDDVVVLDDGSAQVQLRGFEGGVQSVRFDVGQAVLVVGRVRRYGEQRYVTPEIVKPVVVEWLRLRVKELASALAGRAPAVSVAGAARLVSASVDPKPASASYALESILSFIKEHDQGAGVNIELILERVAAPNAEQVIDTLLKQGEIFELTPGVVKLLG